MRSLLKGRKAELQKRDQGGEKLQRFLTRGQLPGRSRNPKHPGKDLDQNRLGRTLTLQPVEPPTGCAVCSKFLSHELSPMLGLALVMQPFLSHFCPQNPSPILLVGSGGILWSVMGPLSGVRRSGVRRYTCCLSPVKVLLHNRRLNCSTCYTALVHIVPTDE